MTLTTGRASGNTPALQLATSLYAVEWQAELKGSRKENEEKKQKAADKAGFKSGNLPRSGKVRLYCQL